MLSNAGVHVPVIPLLDVVGKAARLSPSHMGAIAVKVGVVMAFTVMVSDCDVAHCPAVGVKV